MSHQVTQRSDRQRTVRVFISSTFRDMQTEREEFVKFVFPDLRKRCRERGVEFIEVDLRWGITDEQKAEGMALPICLAEIENCRPYFLGILGGRYGWMPEKIEEELLRDHPWLREHPEHSVTALEILHGVLNNPEMKSRAFFYFRAPETSAIIESELEGSEGYAPEPEASQLKLQELKEEIRQSGYPVRENYPDAKSLGRLVFKDLWDSIDSLYPPEEIPSLLEQERQGHEAFAEARRRVYIGREEYFSRLNKHAEITSPPLVLLGESGSGKSALLANWAQEYREQHPDDLLVLRFIGSTPESAGYAYLLRDIMEEISERHGEAGEIPFEPKKIVQAFPFWLARAASRNRLVLVLDALDQLDDQDNAPDLGWLPEHFPPNIRMILSTLPGRSLDAVRKRGWPAFAVEPLNSQEKKQVIEKYLAQYRKTLSRAQSEKLAHPEQTSNPLYLKAVLEELRVYGYHFRLDERIEYYLSARNLDDLYEKILERYEEDYERERPGLVRESMSLLWGSRRGLTEKELLELLGADGGPLPQAFWSPLKLAAGDSLINRGGLLNFFHGYLRQAIEKRYLRDPEIRRIAHLRLADYFNRQTHTSRKIDELPWQLHRGEEWERLRGYLTDPPIFLELNSDKKRFELLGYWQKLKEKYDMVDAYKASIGLYEKSPGSAEDFSRYLTSVGLFLQISAQHEGVEPIFRQALAINERTLGPEHPDTASCYQNLAGFLESKGDYRGALPLFEKALLAKAKILGPEHLETLRVLNHLAVLLFNLREFNNAEPLYRRVLAGREKILGPEHPETVNTLNNLAVLLNNKGDFRGALPLQQKVLFIREKILGAEHPDTAQSLSNLALILDELKDFAAAEPLHRKSLETREKVLGPEHPETGTSLNNLATHYYSRGNYQAAVPLFRKALSVIEKSLGPEHPTMARSSNNLATVLFNMGDYAGAEPLLRKTLSIREKVFGPEHPDTAQTLVNLSAVLYKKGDLENSENTMRRAISLYEKLLGPFHPMTMSCQKSLFVIQQSRNRGV